MCVQGDAGGGWRSSFPETPGIKRPSRGGEPGASCRIIQARFRLPGDFHGPLQIVPGIKEAGHTDRAISCAHRLRALASSMSRELPLPNWVQFYCRGSSLGGQPHSLQPRPGALRSLQWETGQRAGRQRKSAPRGDLVCPLLPFLWLVAFSCWLRPGLCKAGVPPLGPRCSWRVFPDTLPDFSQFCCFQDPESAFWNASASAVLEVEAQGRVTGSLSGSLSEMALLSEPPRSLGAAPGFLLSPTSLHESLHRLLAWGASPCLLGCFLLLLFERHLPVS